MNLDSFLDHLAAIDVPAGGPFTNPYCNKHVDSRYDVPDAAEIRLANAKNYFRAFPKPPGVLLLGEAPGPWGARFSGVAFTSEAQLVEDKLPFRGKRTSNFAKPCSEMSGTIVWREVMPRWPDVAQWNMVPLHPWKPREPLTIRTPTGGEVRWAVPLLRDFLAALQPQRIIAVGRKAQQGCEALGIPVEYARHPSMGGSAKFVQALNRLIGPPTGGLVPTHSRQATIVPT